jgi:hypothetical protein
LALIVLVLAKTLFIALCFSAVLFVPGLESKVGEAICIPFVEQRDRAEAGNYDEHDRQDARDALEHCNDMVPGILGLSVRYGLGVSLILATICAISMAIVYKCDRNVVRQLSSSSSSSTPAIVLDADDARDNNKDRAVQGQDRLLDEKV